MKVILLQLLALLSVSSAFSPSTSTLRTNLAKPQFTSSLYSSTIETNDSVTEEDLALQVKNQEMEEVKAELVAKYVAAGKSEEYAKQEVDKFLSDPDRSEKYLDMRRYAKAQADELMGFESILVIGGAFFLGLGGNVLIKYISAYKDVYPDGNGPIPFL